MRGPATPRQLPSSTGNTDPVPTTNAQARRQDLLAGAVIGALCSLALGLCSLTGAFDGFDLRLLDMKFQLRGERPGSSSIAIVGVDDETIRRYGSWPLPRDSYALLLTVLEESGAKAIGVDLVFPNDRNQQPEWNTLLAHVSGKYENVVNAIWFHSKKSREDEVMAGALLEAFRKHGSVVHEPRIAVAEAVAVPFEELLASASHLGHVTVPVDRDGGIRRVPLFIGYADRGYPALAVSLFGVAGGARTAPTIDRFHGGARLRWPDGAEMTLPIDAEGATPIDYAGDQGSFPNTYSMLDVLQWYRDGEADRLRATFQGKTVLLGLTSREEASEDVGTTPFSVATPLIYVHANVLDNLARSRFLSRPAWPWTLAVLTALGILLGVGLSRMRVPVGAAATVIVTLLIAALLQTALARHALEIPSMMSLALAPALLVGTVGYRYLFLERRSAIREAEIRQGLSIQQQFLPEAWIGKRISKYRIEEKLGAGGMGVVYRATDSRGVAVAIKLLPASEQAGEETRRRFRHEALALARVRHPGIARLIEFDTQDGIDFIVLEFVPGSALAGLLGRGPFPEEKAISIAGRICEALHAAHVKGVLHRDLKPSNVMLTREGEVKLLDFGIARFGDVGPAMSTITGGMTESGHVMGTLAYMAPEVLRGEPADERTDVYGVGMILFEMLTGQRAFRDDAPHELMYVILNQPPPRPGVLNGRVGLGLEGLVLRMLAKQRNERPSGMDEVRELLQSEASSRRADAGGAA